jgi:formylglycine-generating enzyme required for sulfatase activity
MTRLEAVVPQRPQYSAAEVSCQTDMIWIPGGAFSMGSDKHYRDEAPVHRRTVDSFWIDIAPVTNREFRGGRKEASYDPGLPNIKIPRKALKGGSHLCAPNSGFCFLSADPRPVRASRALAARWCVARTRLIVSRYICSMPDRVSRGALLRESVE